MISKEALKSRLAKIREQSTEAVGTVLQTAEVAGACGALSWVNGRYGAPDGTKQANGAPLKQVMGMPVDLGTAVVLHGLSFTGMLGKQKEHGHNLGDGALACYVARVATGMGEKAKQKALIGQSQAQATAARTAGVGAWQYAGGVG